MVGNKIQHLAHTIILEFADQFLQLFITADLRIQLVVVSNVIAVRAASPRLKNGRRINVGDAESMQVSGQPSRVLKAKARMELQAIRGKRPGSPLLRRKTVQAFGDAAGFRGQDGRIGSHA
jgi:hypothetical protein